MNMKQKMQYIQTLKQTLKLNQKLLKSLDFLTDNIDDINDSYYYIKIGKYLFNDFMLTATMGVNNEEKSLGFHYDLNSRVGL